MKKLKMKLLSVLPALAILFSTISANSTCFYYIHQPKAPEELRKLRKF